MLQLRLVALVGGPRRHLDVEGPTLGLDHILDGRNSLLQQRDALILIHSVGDQHIQRGRNQLHRDWHLIRAHVPASHERLLDGQDSLVCEAGHLHVRAHAVRLRRQAAPDVLQHLRHHVLWHLDALESSGRVRDCQPHPVVRVPKLLGQRPRNEAIQILQRPVQRHGRIAQNDIHRSRLAVPDLHLLDVFRRNAPLGEINVALLPVHTEHHDHLIAPDANQLRDGPDPPPRQL
mmetsp:Transcript_15060/g.48029  ORF Transcript_15060/g.48029 Transcript_15060/m.48029 type:complete len:233 (+) Transcript_15060:93-791(+)